MISIREQQILVCPPRGKVTVECLHGSGGSGLQYNEKSWMTSTVQP